MRPVGDCLVGSGQDGRSAAVLVAIATFADVLSRALCGWLGDEYDRQRLLASFPSVPWSVAHSPRRWAQAQPWQCSAC
ncbi:hypothetical protein C4K40_5694 [Pseudomonas sp. CMR5c]|nr:hypothetical protein C4K40_5694 [Pseudomonas sp. CMR5c]